MKYPAADKALKVSETRASEKLCSAEASASKYLRARKPHSESGDSAATRQSEALSFRVGRIHEVDYLTGEWSKKYEPEYTETETPESESAAGMVQGETKTYVLNVSSKKIHRPDCSSVSKISEKNKEEVQDTLSHLLKEGYTPCGICNPD